MRLRNEVTYEEIDQAHELFELSTMKSIEGKEFGYAIGDDHSNEVQKIEEAIRKRVCIRSVVQTQKLVSEMQDRYNERAVMRAILNMVHNGEFR